MTCASWSGPSQCLILIRPLSAIGPMGSTRPSLFSPPTMINIIISVSFLYFQQLWECLFFSANVPAVKAWLLYSNSAGTQQATCRNKLEKMRTFGMAETDFSSCVEFCELHVDSSGHLWLQLVVSFVKRKSLFQNCSAEVFSQDSQSCVPTPATTTTTTTTSTSPTWSSTSSAAGKRRFIFIFILILQIADFLSSGRGTQAKMFCPWSTSSSILEGRTKGLELESQAKNLSKREVWNVDTNTSNDLSITTILPDLYQGRKP